MKFSVQLNYKIPIKKGKNNEKVYYLISQLGNGSTLKVWQALDSKGNMVVIKMYVKITGKYGEALTRFFYETSNGCNWEGEVKHLLALSTHSSQKEEI